MELKCKAVLLERPRTSKGWAILSVGDSSAACRKSGASGKHEGGAGGRQHAPGKVAARSEERKLFMRGV